MCVTGNKVLANTGQRKFIQTLQESRVDGRMAIRCRHRVAPKYFCGALRYQKVFDVRLYIADDNLEFARFCEGVATRSGWTVSVCGNGAELVDLLKEESGPALLIIDINMPVLDGIEVIDQLHAIPRDLRLRFITGGHDSSALAARMIADARELKVGKYLTKPISVKRLQAVLEEEASTF